MAYPTATLRLTLIPIENSDPDPYSPLPAYDYELIKNTERIINLPTLKMNK